MGYADSQARSDSPATGQTHQEVNAEKGSFEQPGRSPGAVCRDSIVNWVSDLSITQLSNCPNSGTPLWMGNDDGISDRSELIRDVGHLDAVAAGGHVPDSATALLGCAVVKAFDISVHDDPLGAPMPMPMTTFARLVPSGIASTADVSVTPTVPAWELNVLTADCRAPLTGAATVPTSVSDTAVVGVVGSVEFELSPPHASADADSSTESR